jgi:hypothetical protein
MKIVKEIALKADNDDFYNKAKKFGETAARAFGNRHKSQMKNLENIANSTLKVSDVLDYIKKQVSKPKDSWKQNDFGEQLKVHIEGDIRTKNRKVICRTLDIQEDSPEAQRIYLNLTREFVRQLVVHYEYTVALPGAN